MGCVIGVAPGRGSWNHSHMELTTDTLAFGFIWYAVFLFSVTVHEAAHAWAALKLGDSTAYQGGQVTLSPIPHIQRAPVGTVLVPIITYALTGWMMGWASAPYDPAWAARYPRRAGYMALAGPVSNLLIVILSGVAIRLGMVAGVLENPPSIDVAQVVQAVSPGMWEGGAALLSILFTLNLLLFTFNLIPFPPLDGASVLPLLLSESAGEKFRSFTEQPGFALMGLIIAWKIFGEIFWPIMLLAVNLLYPEIGYS